jgi:hypothetical protein
MHAVLGSLLVWAATLGAGTRTGPPVLQEQPLEQPSFVLLYTGDTRGYLESCG